MSRITLKGAACIGLSALLAAGMFAAPASARWGDNDNGNHGYNNGHHEGRDWNANGYYYRAPPVVYGTPYQYGYYPPPVVYGMPGITIQIP
jgi:hypothetical protein